MGAPEGQTTIGPGSPANPGEPSGAIRPRHLAPVAAGSAATTIWLAALGLVTTPFMLHTLGASAYAIFALITIIVAYLSNLELGFGHATVRFLARARAEGDADSEAKIVATSLFIFASGAALAAAIALLSAPFVVKSFAHFPARLDNEATGAVRLAALLLVLTFLYHFALVCLQALGRFTVILGSRLVFGTLLSAAAVGAAAMFGDVRAVLLAQVVISVCSCAVAYVALGRATTAPLRPSFHRPTFRAMRGYGALVLGTGLAYQVMMQGPATVLAGKAPSAEVAAFAIPAIALQQLILLATASSTGFLPFASAESSSEDRDRLATVFRSHLRLTLAVMGPVVGFLVVFAGTLLAAWVGADFASRSEGALRFLVLSALVLALGTPASDVARGLGRPGWNFVYTLVAATLGVSAALLLVEDSGATGAALGLLVGASVATVPFLLFVAYRLLDQAPLRLLTAIAGPSFPALGATALWWAGSTVVPGFAGAVLMGAAVSAAYVLVVYRLTLEELERTTLRAGAARLAPLVDAVRRVVRVPSRRRPAALPSEPPDDDAR